MSPAGNAGTGGRAWTGTFVGAESAGAGLTSEPSGMTVACETGPAVPLLRPGCPREAPHASDCEDEGLRCLYAGAADGCWNEWECLLGLWSPLGESCRGADAPDPMNDPSCTPYVPVEGEPCAGPESSCWYGPCPLGPARAIQVTCTCARSVVESYGCPTIR